MTTEQTMTIEEIRNKKAIVEEKIRDILSEFEAETGVLIYDVNVTIINSGTRCGVYHSLGRVECKVLL